MAKNDIIRFWKDATYRASLSEEMQKNMPQSPVGSSFEELEEANLTQFVGAGDVTPAWEWPWEAASRENDGGYCTLSWECHICPTHTTCLTC